MTVFWFIAFCVALAVLYIALVGGKEVRDELRDDLDNAHAENDRLRHKHAEETHGKDITIRQQAETIRRLKGSNVVPLRDSAAAARVATILAANEAARADWDEVDGWGEGS